MVEPRCSVCVYVCVCVCVRVSVCKQWRKGGKNVPGTWGDRLS